MSFSESSKRHLYLACVKSRFCEYFKNKTDTKWRNHLLVPDEQLPSWHLFYKSPLPKRSGDIQWRILHGALATNTFLYKCNFTTSSVCTFCNIPDTVFHIFSNCYRIIPLLDIWRIFLKVLAGIFRKQCSYLGANIISLKVSIAPFPIF